MESDEQAAIFQWRDLNLNKYPELHLLEGSMNGVKLPIGLAVKAKAAGMRKGKPDIELPVSRGRYHGLFIELKFGRNSPTREQVEYMGRLGDEGNLCVVCYGAKAAVDSIISYLKLEKGKIPSDNFTPRFPRPAQKWIWVKSLFPMWVFH